MWFFLLSQRMQVNDTYLNAGFCPSLLCNLTNGSRARPRVTAAAGPRRYESATVWPGKSRDGVTAGGSRERSRYARPSYCRCDGRGGVDASGQEGGEKTGNEEIKMWAGKYRQRIHKEQQSDMLAGRWKDIRNGRGMKNMMLDNSTFRRGFMLANEMHSLPTDSKILIHSTQYFHILFILKLHDLPCTLIGIKNTHRKNLKT